MLSNAEFWGCGAGGHHSSFYTIGRGVYNGFVAIRGMDDEDVISHMEQDEFAV